MDPSGANFFLAPTNDGVFFDGGVLALQFSPAEQNPCGVCLPVQINPIAQQYAKILGSLQDHAVWTHEAAVACLFIGDRKSVVLIGVAVFQ